MKTMRTTNEIKKPFIMSEINNNKRDKLRLTKDITSIMVLTSHIFLVLYYILEDVVLSTK